MSRSAKPEKASGYVILSPTPLDAFINIVSRYCVVDSREVPKMDPVSKSQKTGFGRRTLLPLLAVCLLITFAVQAFAQRGRVKSPPLGGFGTPAFQTPLRNFTPGLGGVLVVPKTPKLRTYDKPAIVVPARPRSGGDGDGDGCPSNQCRCSDNSCSRQCCR